jgi:AcrR family transcriptional regulator
MARPQSPNYDRRREAIVAAAARLFAHKGFQGASVSELASACGSSKSLIYHYFPSKDDILYEVMAAHLDALVEAAEAAGSEASPEARLRALAHGFMRLYVGAEVHHKVLLNELDSLAPARRREVVAKQRRIITAVEEMVAGLRPGASAQTLPLTMLFFGMINWTHTWFRPDGEIPPERLADMAVALMLNGIGGAAQAS